MPVIPALTLWMQECRKVKAPSEPRECKATPGYMRLCKSETEIQMLQAFLETLYFFL